MKNYPLLTKQRIIVISLAAIAVSVLLVSLLSAGNNNKFIKADDLDENLNIALNAGMDLDLKTNRELLDLRKQAAFASNNPIAAGYKPSSKVFGGLKSGLVWWNLARLNNIPTDLSPAYTESLESIHFLNPMMLIGANFYSLNRSDKGILHFTDQQLNIAKNEGLDLILRPTSLVFNLHDKKATLTFDVSKYLTIISYYFDNSYKPSDISFLLRSYNAKDFGFNFFAINQEDTKSVKVGEPGFAIHPIVEKLESRSQKDCPDVEECNHIDLNYKTPQEFSLEGLPASLSVNLWKNISENEINEPKEPNYKYEILFN